MYFGWLWVAFLCLLGWCVVWGIGHEWRGGRAWDVYGWCLCGMLWLLFLGLGNNLCCRRGRTWSLDWLGREVGQLLVDLLLFLLLLLVLNMYSLISLLIDLSVIILHLLILLVLVHLVTKHLLWIVCLKGCYVDQWNWDRYNCMLYQRKCWQGGQKRHLMINLFGLFLGTDWKTYRELLRFLLGNDWIWPFVLIDWWYLEWLLFFSCWISWDGGW